MAFLPYRTLVSLRLGHMRNSPIKMMTQVKPFLNILALNKKTKFVVV
jgi:hypothetical protein